MGKPKRKAGKSEVSAKARAGRRSLKDLAPRKGQAQAVTGGLKSIDGTTARFSVDDTANK